MARDDPRRTLEALASEPGLPILRFLRGRDWTLASQVAHGLGVHTTTASKYLAAFHEAGFLDRKEYPAKRTTRAYRLRSPVIRLEFDLGERVPVEEAREFGIAFAEALLAAARRLGGSRLTASLARAACGDEDWRACLERRFAETPDARQVVNAVLGDARRASAELLGAASGGRLVRIAWDAAVEGRQDLVIALGLSEAQS